MTEPEVDSTPDVPLGYGITIYEHVCKRLDALRALGEAALVLPERIVQRPDGAVVASYPSSEALTLDQVLDRHGPFSAGESVWWASEVARLLSLLHRNGLVHANLDSDAVLFDGEGIKIARLVEPVADLESASAGADVHALGALLEECVKVEDAERIGAWTEPMTSAMESARPTAAMVARALMSCAPPQPLVLEHMSVAHTLRNEARRSHETTASPPLSGHGLIEVLKRRLAGFAALHGFRVPQFPAPVERKRPVGLAVLAVATCAIALFVVPWLWTSGQSSNGSAPANPRGLETFAPEAAATALTVSRVESLAQASDLELLSVSAPTSVVRALDLTRVLTMRAGGETATQTVEVLEAHRSGQSRVGAESRAQPRVWVSVTYVLTSLDGQGSTVTESVALLLGRNRAGEWDVHAALQEA